MSTQPAVLESPNQALVKELMDKYAHAGVTNEPVLMTDMEEMMRLKNNGFPLWMYHPELLPEMCMNKPQMTALKGIGYREHYFEHAFPQMVYRRNMDPKFAESPLGEYTEGRTVKSQSELDAAMKERKPKTVAGTWCGKVGELPEVEAGPSEDPKVTIARLEGELKQQREAAVIAEAGAKTKAKKEA